MSTVSAELALTYIPEARRGPGLRAWASIAGAVAIAAFADRQVTKMVWPENGTFVSDEDSNVLVLGGIGEMGGHRVRDVLAESVDVPMCAVQYSNRGISREKLGRAFIDHYRRPRWEAGQAQTLVTHSMGLPLSLGAIAEIVERGSGDEVPEISEIHSISSPMSAGDTYMDGALRIIRHTPKDVAGITTKLSVGWVYALNRLRERLPEGDRLYTPVNIAKLAGETLAEAGNQLAPPTWFTMAREMSKAGDYRDGIFQGIITPDTRIHYYFDREDRVVKTEKALGRLAALADEYGATVCPEETPGLGHANIESVSQLIAKNMS
jgi:hypothetical protein